jgi:O-antigen biosynthesis protein WbqV
MTPGLTAALSSIDWDAITQRPPFAIDWGAVRDRVSGRTVLVTGAAGSLGAPLSLALARAGPARLVLYDHHEASLFHARESLGAAQPAVPLRAVLGDVRDTMRLHRLLQAERPHLVFHLAAYKHVPWGEEDAAAFADANVRGARNVIEAAHEAGSEQIVYPSTDKAIDPPSLYGATKRLVEMMLYARSELADAPRCTIVRFVNVLGSRGSAPETFTRQLLEGRALTVTDRAMRRYWITPDHARVLLLHAACQTERAMTVTPDAGDEISVLDIARRVTLALRPEARDPQIAITGLRPGERLTEPIVAPHERLEPLPLPGLMAVRGGVSPPLQAVTPAVTRLLNLLAQEDANDVVRRALFEELTALQSRP